ncbi:MAG: cation:proton antiporter [Candidatus Diapherotrites archaeon]|nr:cation:proton antiporter [Candidatus Diapherotrites archaeon]
MYIDPSFLIQLGVVLISAKAMGELFTKFRQPSMLGEILAGVILGPFALGWVAATPGLETLAAIGILSMIFLIGLEFNIRSIFRMGATTFLVAAGGITLPIVMAVVLLPGEGALFIGAAMAATSIGVAARVLADMGRLKSEEGRLVTTAAVVDDIVGVIILAVITVATTAWAVAQMVLQTVAFLALIVFAAISFSYFWGYKALSIKRSIHESSLLPLFLGGCFLLAWLSTQIQLAAVVGAFTAGVFFSEIHDKKHVMQELKPFYEVFVPIFFFYIGMHVNLGAALGAGLAVVSLLAIAFLGKLVGSGLPALLSLPPRKSLVVGLAMVPRMELALAIVSAGLLVGKVDAALYSSFVIVVLVTLAASPWLIEKAYSFEIKKHL